MPRVATTSRITSGDWMAAITLFTLALSEKENPMSVKSASILPSADDSWRPSSTIIDASRLYIGGVVLT